LADGWRFRLWLMVGGCLLMAGLLMAGLLMVGLPN
jgi:hypothetical protein